MSNELMQAMYEEGRTVKEIAEAMECSPSDVHALLTETDGSENALTVRQQKYARQLRRVRSLADTITLQYLEQLQAVIADEKSTGKEKANAFCEMDKVLRISKQYSDRVLLAEGKTTENIGLDGSLGMPMSMACGLCNLLKAHWSAVKMRIQTSMRIRRTAVGIRQWECRGSEPRRIKLERALSLFRV